MIFSWQKKTVFNTKLSLSISQRILLSFLILVCLSFFIPVINILGLNDFYNQFSSFKHVSEDTNRMLTIDNDIADLQQAILIFSHSAKGTSAESMIYLHQILLDDVKDLQKNMSFRGLSNTQLLSQLIYGIEVFKEKIYSLEVQKNSREKLINDTLPDLFLEVNTIMSAMFFSADESSNNQLTPYLLRAQRDIYNAETIGGRYFNQREFDLKLQVNNGFEQAIETLKKAREYTVIESDIHQIDSVIVAIKKINKVFNQAVQADRNYLFIIKVVIAGELGELTNLADELTVESIFEQSHLFYETQKKVSESQQFVFFSSLLGAVLAIATAIFFGRPVRYLLKSITHTFQRLADGENQLEIPGIERKDEIGSLAKAANIFRESNVRTMHLLSQSESLAKELRKNEQELKSAVSEAREASLYKSQFLANMSHELRTPMNAVLGMLGLLNKTKLNERQRDYVVKTEGAARSLLVLLNDILDISKAESGKMELDPHPFSLKNLIRDLSVILSSNLLDERNVKLTFDIDAGIPNYLFGDAMRLQQILINLGSNAIKFTTHGHVSIKVSKIKEENGDVFVLFSIEDTGIGISQENQEKVFSGFIQAEASITRQFGGTGLGLSICQYLVEQMGGRLLLDSELGKGSRFYFSLMLPVISDSQINHMIEDSDDVFSLDGNKTLEKMNVLLVEDNINNQQIAQELLVAEGAIVTIANNGQEAIDLLTYQMNNHKPLNVDVVLMDLQMPVLDGLSATKIIRQTLGLKSLPIIAMTANAMASDKAACLQVGMNDHIGKPFDLNHLLRTLREKTQWEKKQEEKTQEDIQTIKSEPKRNTELSESTLIPDENISEISSVESVADKYNIDFNGAVRRFRGKHSLYLKMLPKILDSFNKLPDKIQENLLDNDTESLTRELHSLKGVAATMGIMYLSEEAQVCEGLFNQDTPTDEIHHSITHICSSISKVCPHLQELQLALDTMD